MKTLALRFSLVVAVAVFALFATAARAQQAQQSDDAGSDRLQRLERRLNELSERQRQGGVNQQQPGQQSHMAQPGHPMPTPNGVPSHDERARKGLKDFIGLMFLCCIIFNILIAIWIFSDIRKRGTGSGIFIVLALIAGIPTAIIYALVRIGDNKLLERTTIATP